MKDALRIWGAIAGAIVIAWLILLALALVCRGLLELADSLWPADPASAMLITRADFPGCMTIKPPPLLRRKGVNLYPRRSDTA